jgi:hypothetical protein
MTTSMYYTNIGNPVYGPNPGAQVIITIMPWVHMLDDGTVIDDYYGEYQNTATASVEMDAADGLLKARFRLMVLTTAVGAMSQAPDFPPNNPVYPSDAIGWIQAAAIVGLAVSTQVTVGGQTFTFSGGGTDLGLSTPPAFLSLVEPLACPSNVPDNPEGP